MNALADVATRIRSSRHLTVLTGAGVSAASGVPTFRGPAGLWKQYRAEDLATPQAFARDPALVWEWYDWRRQIVAACQPNAAHHVIAHWSTEGTPGVRPRYDPSPGSDPGTRRLKVAVLTQNVDDLHVRAGTADLVRLHGSIWELCCAKRCGPGTTPWRDERVPLPQPRCPYCDALARPAVVWFGESLRAEDVDAATRATTCDVFLTVGTSAIVYPAAGLIQQARQQGAFTAEINLEATPASAVVDVAIQGAAEAILPELDRLLKVI